MGSGMHYLIVEDEVEMAALIQHALENESTKISIAYDGEMAIRKLQSEEFDLAIMDIMIPKINGLEVAKRIRLAGINLPILFLTARDAVTDRVKGLEVGGDDYLVKPFEFIELKARVKALTRRVNKKSKDLFVIGELRVEVSSQRVYLGSKQLTLSPKEFLLLLFLVRNMDISFSRQQILEEVWGTTDFIDPNVVDQYVSYLRKKLDSKNKSPMIETIRGVGYRFNRRVT
jgi:two-component system OmpR family response regulator